MLEWQGKNADGYYAVGTYTVKVRAKDTAGAYSEWVEKSFTVANSAPTRPIITRTPNVCRLVEVQVKFRDVLKSNKKTMRPLYELVYTGKLEFLIYEKHTN